jgi:hypothetical protein
VGWVDCTDKLSKKCQLNPVCLKQINKSLTLGECLQLCRDTIQSLGIKR